MRTRFHLGDTVAVTCHQCGAELYRGTPTLCGESPARLPAAIHPCPVWPYAWTFTMAIGGVVELDVTSVNGDAALLAAARHP